MSLRSRASLVLLLGLWGVREAHGESADERFEQGRLEFEHKRFAEAINQLQPLVNPQIQLTREKDIAATREMLGLAYFYTGQETRAIEEFRALIRLRPQHTLDAFLVPPPAVRFFEKVQDEPDMREIIQKSAAPREPERPARQPDLAPGRAPHIIIERRWEKHSRWIAWLPFGLGQFQNGEIGKGTFLATTGGIFLTGNIASYLGLVALANDNGRYASSNLSVARGLRVTQYTTLGLFLATWLYGAIDANLHFVPFVASPPEAVPENVPTPRLGPGLSWLGRF